MHSKQYQLVVFDWDGTLMDSIGRIVSSMRSAAQNAGVQLPTDASTKGIIGMSIMEAVLELFPDACADTREKIAQGYRHAYLETDETPALLFEGALALLSELKQQGYKLAVATGKTRAGLDRVLVEHQLTEFFDVTVTGDEHVSKPHPSMLHHIIETLAVPASSALMVGDSPLDIKMAQAARLDSVAVGCGAVPLSQLEALSPTHAIDHTCDLLKVLNPV